MTKKQIEILGILSTRLYYYLERHQEIQFCITTREDGIIEFERSNGWRIWILENGQVEDHGLVTYSVFNYEDLVSDVDIVDELVDSFARV